jgi:hypothetical protein
MTEFNTSKRDYFKTQQSIITSNNIYDLEQAVLATKLSKALNLVNVPSDWRNYFYAYGYTDAFATHLTALWFRWLTEKGFTQGSLRGKFKAFYDDGTVDL